MATFIWKRVKGGSPSARVFSAYLALVLTIAMVGPGLSVYAEDGAQKGRASEPVVEPAVEAEPVEPVVEEPVVEEPVVEAEPVEPVVEEPIAQESASEPAAVATAEEPVEPSREIATTVAPLVVASVAPLSAGARPICEGGVKLDGDPRSGTYTITTADVEVTPTTPTDFEITISTYDNGAGMLFDFTSNYPVTHIGVKGGNTGYSDYYFDPPATSGTGLHAPMNPSGKWADISHIIFCFGEEPVHDAHIIVMKFRDDVVTNGVHDGGENWLAGFAFRLESGDSEDGPWSFVADVTTEGMNGQADFGMRPVGWYRLTEILTQDQIDAGETPTTGDPLGQMVFHHTGEVNSEKRFGNIITEEPEEGDLIVYKYHDLNENGTYDQGEPMLEDWEFTLSAGDADLDSGLTDIDGELLFSALEPGVYTVTETLEDGWTNITPLSQDVTVVDGQTVELRFGNIPTIDDTEEGDLIVYKYHDLNENGTYDQGEPMLEDWEFTLYQEPVLAEGPTLQAIMIDSGLTDIDGELLFGGLEPGVYTVTETLEDGWTNITPLSQDVTVVDGQTVELRFGNIPTIDDTEEGDLIVYKYHDLNENGTYDQGEPMLEDWEFTLSAGDADLDSGLTDIDGELLFGGLEPGVYTVTETLEDGWTNITPLSQDVTVVDGQTASLWFGNVEEFLPFTELDLAITKLANKAEADPGELITYTLTYWNTGELAAYNFTITDDFDERYVTVVDAAGGTVVGGKITWTIAGPLAMEDGKQTITYTVRVKSAMPDGVTNVDNVVVIDHPLDSDPSNNTDDERVVVRVVVEEPFLPFTGGEYALLIAIAAGAATLGTALRLRRDQAA